MRRTLALALVILSVLTLALTLPAAPSRSSHPPPAVQLSVSVLSSTGVRLAWSGRFSAVAGFKIERSTDRRIFIQIAAAGADATNYTDTGLIPNTSYSYRVRSFNASGDSRDSNLVRVQTPGPAAPLALVEWGENLVDPPDGLSNVVAVAAGDNHRLALKVDGTVVGWGGDSPLLATAPTNLSDVVAIAAGGFHSLALKRDGTVVGWGHNEHLQATLPASLNNIVAIAAGGFHSLALKANGTVIGWGDDSLGQAQPPANLHNVVALAAGDIHSLALKADGTVIGWGDNSWGQAQPPAHLKDVVAIAAGRAHSLALKRDGTVVQWGSYSQPWPYLAGVVAIAAGGDHSLALKSDGTVDQWSYDYPGGWVPAPALVGVTAIAAGGSSSLALSILPATPLRLAARIADANQVDLSWHDNSDTEDSFIIERMLEPGFESLPGQPSAGTWTQIATVGAGITQYEDTAIVTNLTYRYRVCAHNPFGRSPSVLPVIVVMEAPSAPIWQMTAIGSTNQVDLAWLCVVAADGFRIERAPDAGGSPGVWSEIGGVLLTNTCNGAYTDTNVTALTTNWYRVRGFNVLGTSPYSEAERVEVRPPTAPNYLSASAFRDQVNLSWSFYDPYRRGVVNGFKIERAPDAGGSPGTWVPIATVTVSNRDDSYFNYTDPERAVNIIYWYRVRAFNWVGEGAYSPIANATVVLPAAPTELYGRIGVTHHQVMLLWSKWPTDADGFRIERASDNGGSPGIWEEIGVRSLTNQYSATYTDMRTIALTTNWYRVRAFNNLGTSPYSEAARVEVVPPPAPNYLSASVFRDQIRLDWLLDYRYGDVSGFQIERAPDVNGRPGRWAQVASVGGNSYTDSNRISGATYWYRVRAFNWVGKSGYSLTTSATISPPAAPALLTGQIGTTNHQVNLWWYEFSGDQDGFQIERAPDTGGNPGTWTKIGTLLAADTGAGAFTDTNVTALSTNWYRIRAFNGLGTSPYSEATCVKIVPPPAPGYLSAIAFRNQINLAWPFEYGSPDKFKVERAPDIAGGPGPWAQLAIVDGNSYADTDRALGATSWYRVRAFNWVGDGGYSTIASAAIMAPAAPTDLFGQIGGTNQVNLSWFKWPADEDGFGVERAPDSGGSPGSWTEICTLAVTNYSNAYFSDTNVTALTTNWYRVRAFSGLGTSPYSQVACVQVVPPPAPDYLSAKAFRDQISLAWIFDFSYGAVSGFKIERAQDVGGSPGAWVEIESGASGYYATSYTDTDRTAGATYWYRVRAFNWVGDGAYSLTASATPVVPAAPTDLTGQIGATHQVNLSWSKWPADEDGFKIERALDAGGRPGLWTEIGTLPATNYSNAFFTDTNVTAPTTNWYRVRAFNNVGASPYSQVARVPVVPPPAPYYLFAHAFRNEIAVTWYSMDGADGFKLERAPAMGGPWAQIASTAGTSYTDTNLTSGATYFYRLRAFNWVGDGDYSAWENATIKPSAAPSPPSAQIGVTNHQVNLAWTEYPADEDGFRVERAPDAGGNPGAWREIGVLLVTNAGYASYTDTNVTALTTNWYRVRAFNILGASSYSEAACLQVVPPPAPDYFYTYVFRDQISLAWNFDYSYGAVSGFSIERARDIGGHPGAWAVIANTAGDVSYYMDVNRAVNTTYWYRVRAVNWVGKSDYSPAASATISLPAAPVFLSGQVGPNNHQVNLWWYETSWDQNGFQIERAPDTGGIPGMWTKIGTLFSTNTSDGAFTDTNVKALSTNWYRVRAFNGLGTSPYSEAIRVQVIPPAAPGYLVATPFRDQINLSWSFNYNYGAVNGFKIERAPDIGGGPGTWTQISSMADNGYTDSNRTSGATYWYRVRAFNWVGTGGYSPVASATILAPAAPTGLTGRIGATNRVNLSWNKWPADEDGFSVERAPDAEGEPGVWMEIGTLGATYYSNVSFTDTNVTALTTNWYRVRAFNNVGTSSYSQAARVRVVPPPAPNYLWAHAFRDQAMLSWSEDLYYYGIVDGFKIERALDVSGSPGAWVEIAGVASEYNQSYNDTNRTTGATYWYRVRACNWVGDGDYSPTASVTIVPPVAPTSLGGQIGTTNQVNLSWYENSADQDGFQVDRASDAGGSPGLWTEIGTLPATNNSSASFIDTNVTALTTNWYRVRAFNSLGTSAYSQVASVYVVPPLPPYYIYVNTSGNQIYLQWQFFYNYAGLQGAKIERAPDASGSPGAWLQIAIIDSSYYYGSYSDTNVLTGGTYWYRVRGFNWVGVGDYSQPADATIVLVTGAATSLAVPSLAAAPLRITSLMATNCDVLLVWQAIGGTTNVVEAASTPAGGFTNLSGEISIAGSGLSETNYLDVGALTNAAGRFYRVKTK